MDEHETGWIEINGLAYQRVREYAHELRRIKEGVRLLAADVDALAVEGSSAIAAQLIELLDPLQTLQTNPIIEDNDSTGEPHHV